MNELVDKALAVGFTKAVFLNDLKLECEARLRAYCNPKDCPMHGMNWVCPPGCGRIEYCQAKVSQFQSGILLQSLFELDPPTPMEKYQALNREHNFRLKEFREAINDKSLDSIALTTGGCIFCATCAFPNSCIKPNLRMSSLSAYGIDVGKLCEKAQWEYSFRPDRVYYVALVLLKC